ncbi:hypothetical protein SDC9_209317 [bioreactor metagenome]|uniref:STAS domain-containing protein n=1 Tax=bioreactor metagenome TaxID=1076179 RepID=A0A645JFY6_9ZZZZ
MRVIEIGGPFFFGSASQLVERVDPVIGTRAVVFDCSRVPFMDLSAEFALEEMVEGLAAQSITSYVVVPEAIRTQLLALASTTLTPQILMPDLAAALTAAHEEEGQVSAH